MALQCVLTMRLAPSSALQQHHLAAMSRWQNKHGPPGVTSTLLVVIFLERIHPADRDPEVRLGVSYP